MAQKKTQTERFTAEERAAMRERAKETKREQSKAEGEADLLAAIAKMPDVDRVKAERIHKLVTAAAPGLAPKTWYGMPAYADDEGKVVCFFRNASKFKTRYATFGFSDKANLDDGSMWATDYAIADITKADEKRITDLVTKAVS
ncbi:MAG TPA: hypothetical protein VGL44_10100 [Gaiellales bacterium]|jgi:uncharacterized protein YdhG (YjbR/CyaY superfamily)